MTTDSLSLVSYWLVHNWTHWITDEKRKEMRPENKNNSHLTAGANDKVHLFPSTTNKGWLNGTSQGYILYAKSSFQFGDSLYTQFAGSKRTAPPSRKERPSKSNSNRRRRRRRKNNATRLATSPAHHNFYKSSDLIKGVWLRNKRKVKVTKKRQVSLLWLVQGLRMWEERMKDKNNSFSLSLFF